MFQTEPILFLQSLASDGLTYFMEAVTQMGYDPFLIGVMMLVTLGVSLRGGFFLVQLMFWNGVVTDVLKHLIALPRPIYVDSNVQNLRLDRTYHSEYTGMGARGLFEFLDRQMVEAFRLQEDPSYGFPSGHVSSTTTLWGGIALLFRKRVLRWIALVMVVLMALSRMYFGRHFLADVIGGAVVGGVVLLVAHQLLARYPLEHLYHRSVATFAARLPSILFFLFGFVAPVLLILMGWLDGDDVGYLLGTNAAFLLLMLRGLPDDSGTLPQRVARVLIGVLMFLAVKFAVDLGLGLVSVNDEVEWVEFVVEFVATAIPVFASFLGAIAVCVKVGLYKREG